MYDGFRGNGGSDSVSECASNDGVATGDGRATGVVSKRQQTPTDLTAHARQHQIPASSASSTRRHDYHRQIAASYDSVHSYNAANDAPTAASYLPETPLPCIPPYFTTNVRANLFHSNHAVDASAAGLYSMQRA